MGVLMIFAGGLLMLYAMKKPGFSEVSRAAVCAASLVVVIVGLTLT